MKFTRYLVALFSVAFCVFAFGHTAWSQPKYAHTGPTIITGIRVIDGLGNAPKENQDIVLADGKILGIGPSGSLKAPKGAMKIDGKGLTAMPGLIDMHIHLIGGWANATLPGEKYEVKTDDKSVQQTLSAHLYSGVTAVHDMGNPHLWILKMRERINRGELLGPRLFATGAVWNQVPSGWGAEGAPTMVTDLAAIPEQMDRYKKDGIEIIKLYNGISPHAARSVVEAAHKRSILVVADFWALNMDNLIMQMTGLDGWAHSAGFEEIPVGNMKWMADNNRFVIVTTVVGEKMSGLRVKDEAGKKLMLKEPLIVDVWGKDEVEDFYKTYPKVREGFYEGPDSFYQQNGFGELTRFRGNFLKNVKSTFDGGVLVVGGSDAPFPSVWPGESMHREMELLVMAGITAIDAIKICTYNGAKILRREKEFGSLQKGLSADILIVGGNPAENISDSRNVRYVFLRGKLVDRESLKFKK